MIKTTELTKVFRTDEVETTALNKVNINVQKGEFVAVMGPSGCGKSTLLNIVGLIDNLTGGQYFFDGLDVSKLTVFENVELPLVYMRIRESERRKKVESILERMKIGHRRGHFPQQLSGGQQQRVAIARAVVAGPKLILADEPTGNLDSKNGLEVMKLLSELNKEGTTIVMVTHSERDSGYAHRVVNLFDGRIVTEEMKRSMEVTAMNNEQ
jgi:putative ABC transport system ATP-binding protein